MARCKNQLLLLSAVDVDLVEIWALAIYTDRKLEWAGCSFLTRSLPHFLDLLLPPPTPGLWRVAAELRKDSEREVTTILPKRRPSPTCFQFLDGKSLSTPFLHERTLALTIGTCNNKWFKTNPYPFFVRWLNKSQVCFHKTLKIVYLWKLSID